MTSRCVHVREKKVFFFFPLTGVNDGDFFLVVGVLIWTIPAILLWRLPLHWWSCVGHKTVCYFDVFWLTFFVVKFRQKKHKIALFRCSHVLWDEYGCPQRVIQGVGCFSELALVPQ